MVQFRLFLVHIYTVVSSNSIKCWDAYIANLIHAKLNNYFCALDSNRAWNIYENGALQDFVAWQSPSVRIVQ